MKTAKCETCGEAFEFPKWQAHHRRFCSKPCARQQDWRVCGAPWPADLDIPSADRKRWCWRLRGVFARCFNPAGAAWKNYGGRGITVHEPWVRDPAQFIRYLAGLPGFSDPALTLDRIDNDKGYEPGNLRLATKVEQRHNSRDYRGYREPRRCEFCRRKFTPPGGRARKFCSRPCAAAKVARRPQPCAVCRKKFVTTRNRRKTCGAECQARLTGRYDRRAS